MPDPDEGKRDKSSVDYGAAGMDATEKCEWCRYFLPAQSKCRKVKGAISPGDWCVLFERKRQGGAYAAEKG